MLAFLIGFRSSWEKLERRSSATKVVLVLCVEKSVKRQICFGLTFGLKKCPICFPSKIRKILITTVFGPNNYQICFRFWSEKVSNLFSVKNTENFDNNGSWSKQLPNLFSVLV